jgi:hypothetical protein
VEKAVRYGIIGDRREGVGPPSSMFLMRTLRSAASLSTTNCSLSEVMRRTIVGDEMKVEKEEGKTENDRV